MFTINTVFKSTEQDSFEQGCIGDVQESDISITFKAATIEDLIKQFADFCGCDVSEVQRNVCDEIGRIECQRTENVEGYELRPAEVREWKAGKLMAYAATYTAYVYEAKPVAV